MNGNENKKAPEELADEALDAVAGGACVTEENGVVYVNCSCGAVITVPQGVNRVECPVCRNNWQIVGKAVLPCSK